MPNAIASLNVDVGANLARLHDGLKEATSAVEKAGRAMGLAFDGVNGNIQGVVSRLAGFKGALVGLASAAGVGTFAALIQSSISAQAELARLSEKTGASVESLSALKQAAKITDTDLNAVTTGIAKLSKSMFEAATKGGDTAQAFKGLGIAVTDAAGALRKPDEVLLELANRFGEMENGAEKVALAQKLLGRSGQELIPVLNEIALVGEYQVKVTERQAALADDYEKNLRRLAAAQKGIWQTIAKEATLALDALVRGILQVYNQVGGLRQVINGLAADGSIAAWAQRGVVVVAELIDAVVDVIHFFGALIESAKEVGSYLNGLWQILAGGSLILKGELTLGIESVRLGWERMKASTVGIRDIWTNLAPSHQYRDAVTQSIILLQTTEQQVSKTKVSIDKFKEATAANFDSLAAAYDRYYKALADFAKAAAQAQAGVATELIKEQLQDVDRAYQRGILSFQAYYARRTQLERESIAIQRDLAQQEVDIQQRLVQSLIAQLEDLESKKALAAQQDKNGRDDLLKWNAQVLGVYAAIAKAQGDLVTAQGKLAVSNMQLANTGKEYLEGLIKANPLILQSVQALEQEVERQKFYNDTLGLTADQIEAVRAARIADLIVQERAKGTDEDTIKNLVRQIELRGQLATELRRGEDIKQYQEGWSNLFRDLTDRGAAFIEDFVHHGGSAFKRLWEDFKGWALSAFAKLAAQTIVVNLVGAFAPSLSGIASNALFGGATNPLSLLFGAGKLFGGGAGGGAGGGTGLFGGIFSGLGNWVSGLSGGAGGFFGGLGGGITNLGVEGLFGGTVSNLSGAFGAFGAGNILGGLGSLLAGALPIAGIVAAIGSLFGLFGKHGGPKEGGYAQTPGFTTEGTEAYGGRWIPENQFDASVQAVVDSIASGYKSILASLGGTGTAEFGLGYTTDPKGTAGNILHAGALVNGQRVYDVALSDLGRDANALQERITLESKRALLAALQASDLPTYLASVFKDVDVASASSETIDNLIATAQALKQVVDTVQGLGGAIGSLDPESIKALVEQFGGLDSVLKGQSFIFDNFFTDAQKMQKATDQLDAAFANLGVEVPKTHEAFLALLNGLDLTTDAGRAMYAALVQLAPLWVQVNGTAEQAAQAAAALANNAETAANSLGQVNEQLQQIGRIDLGEIGNEVNNEFQKVMQNVGELVSGSGLTDFGQKLALQMKLVTSEIGGYQARLDYLIGIGQGGYAEAQGLVELIRKLQQSNVDTAAILARYTVLAAQFDAARAEQLVGLEEWYKEQQEIFSGNAEALAALSEIFKRRWDEIVNGTQQAVSATQSQLESLREQIKQWLAGLKLGGLSPLSPYQQLQEAQKQFEDALRRAAGGDTDAMASLTRLAEAYLTAAKGYYTTASTPYQQIFAAVIAALSAFTGPPPTGGLEPNPGAPGGTTGPGNPALPTAVTDVALMEALPSNGGRLASDEDVRAQTAALNAKLTELIAALADSNSRDSAQATAAMQQALARAANDLASAELK